MGYSPWGRTESDTTERLLFFFFIQKEEGFPDGSVVKNLPASAGDVRDASSIPGLGRCPRGQPTPVFLPGESHVQRSLVGCSPWDCRVGHN